MEKINTKLDEHLAVKETKAPKTTIEKAEFCSFLERIKEGIKEANNKQDKREEGNKGNNKTEY